MPFKINPYESYVHNEFRDLFINSHEHTIKQRYDHLFDSFYFLRNNSFQDLYFEPQQTQLPEKPTFKRLLATNECRYRQKKSSGKNPLLKQSSSKGPHFKTQRCSNRIGL